VSVNAGHRLRGKSARPDGAVGLHPTTIGQIQLAPNRCGPDRPTLPEARDVQMRAKDRKKIDFTKIDSTQRSCRPTAPGQYRPKSMERPFQRLAAAVDLPQARRPAQEAENPLGRAHVVLFRAAHEERQHPHGKSDVWSCRGREVEEGANQLGVTVALRQQATPRPGELDPRRHRRLVWRRLFNPKRLEQRCGVPRVAQSSAVVPKVNLWFLMGDTMATQYDKVSPESRAGRLHVSQTVTPREHFSGG